jgi:hypothetical protein
MEIRVEEKTVEDHYSGTRGAAVLWFGFLGGAAAWKGQLMVNYMLVPYACWHGLSITIHLASLAFLLLALWAGWTAWGSWQETGGHPRGEGGYDRTVSATMGRSRFMAVSGVIMSAYFALVILGQWIPNLLLSPCFGID